MNALTEYSNIKTSELKDIVKDTADEMKNEIKETAPKDTKQYSKSWGVTVVKETANLLNIIIHSKKRYQLTHLLEFGHALRKGGRTKAIPHIAPVEEKGVKEFERKVEEVLSKNG